MIKIIAFDFDGVIADSIPLVLKIREEISSKKLDKKAIQELKNTPSSKGIWRPTTFNFKLPFLIKKIKNELYNRIHEIHPFKDIKKTLKGLKNAGHILGIISSNNEKNILAFLQNHELEIFDFIEIDNVMFGKKKLINKILNQYQIPRSQFIYVGDETRDIEAARKADVKIIAVTWGLNSKKILKEFKPDYLINHPDELAQIVMD